MSLSLPSPTQNDSSLVELLQCQAQASSGIGYTYLLDRGHGFDPHSTLTLSYEELAQQAKIIAINLQEKNCQGDRLLLIYPPGLEFIRAFFGCLMAGAIAVPVYPPRPKQKQSRLEHIIADSGAKAVLTTLNQLPNLKKQSVGSLPLWTTDEWVKESQDQPNDDFKVDRDAIALIQYTSGSTGQPKGVVVTHRNLLHNLQVIYEKFGHSHQSQGVIWLPPYHDMGLVGGILQPLYGGFPVVLMSPVSCLRKPIDWLKAISHYRATTSGGPNFAFDRCVERIKPEQKQSLDLSSWEVAFVGAEPVQYKTLMRFTKTFSECGFKAESFYPCYGLAEATLLVTGGEKSKQPAYYCPDSQKTWVSCGSSPKGDEVQIVDRASGLPLKEGEIGEIWVASPSVAEGYWQQPEETQATFQGKLATGEGTFLRTGDLGFLREGELFVTGRSKELMIIRGQNIYPQDIEDTVGTSHEFLCLGAGAAFGYEIDGEEQLVIVQEVTRAGWHRFNQEGFQQEIVEKIRRAVAQEHGINVYAVKLIKPGHLPKTSSGKIQRMACKAEFENGGFEEREQGSKGAMGDKGDGGEPITNNQQPITNNQQPITNNQQPITNNQQPITNNQQPITKTEERLSWLRDYANSAINSQVIDQRRCIPPSIVLDFGNQGLLGMQVPESYGGLELGHRDTLRILEQLGAIDPTLSLFVGLNNVLGIRPILRYAQPSVQERFLPTLATGRELAAFALTEAEAGSHPLAIRTTAQCIGRDRLSIRGQKIWSGSAAWAAVTNLFVQEQDEAGNPIGISGFIVSKGMQGLRQGPEALTMGMRGMVQNTIELDGVSVGAEQRLGEAGQGMSVAQEAMMYGRLAIAAASLGGMKRCAQLLLRYSDRRQVATGKLLNNPAVLTRFGEITAAITALEALVETIATRLDRHQDVPVEAYTACKILAPEFYWQTADHLMQCLGGRGYIETNLAPQILRDARILRVFEGPTETLSLFLGSQVLNDRATLDRFLSHELKAPEIAKALFEGATSILDRLTRNQTSPWDNPYFARQQASLLIGELASFALLWAVVAQKTPLTSTEGSEAQQLAVQWAKAKFELKLALAQQSSPDEMVTNSAIETVDRVASYQTAIGDLEQSLPGEDRELDPYLRKEFKLGNREQERQTDKDNSAVEQWLIQWISQHLKIPIEEIAVHKAFADYGLDSVTALEMAQDIEEAFTLTRSLDSTVAWNFPTIQSLAEYISQQQTDRRSSAGKGSSSEPSSDACEPRSVVSRWGNHPRFPARIECEQGRGRSTDDSLLSLEKSPPNSGGDKGQKATEDEDLEKLSESELAAILASELGIRNSEFLNNK